MSWLPFPVFSRALRFAAIRVAVMLDRCNCGRRAFESEWDVDLMERLFLSSQPLPPSGKRNSTKSFRTWASRQFLSTVAHSFHNTAKLTPRRAGKLNADHGRKVLPARRPVRSSQNSCGAVQPVQFRHALAKAEF